MLDRSRIQGFGSDSIDAKDAKEDKTIWGSGSGVQGALNSVSLHFSGALDELKEEMDRPWTPLQDISDMAQEIKSFVAGAAGIEQTAGPAAKQDTSRDDASIEEGGISPRQRSEAKSLISNFCQSYKAARVKPTSDELVQVWSALSILQPNAVASVMYDQLSFSHGEFEWQPRLRLLYLLELLYWKGGSSKDIALGIETHAKGLLQHLATEVPQTSDMAKEVLETLAGNVEEPPVFVTEVENFKALTEKDKATAKPAAKGAAKAGAVNAKAKCAAPPQPKLSTAPQALDLLDLGSPSLVPSPSPKASGPADFLSSDDLIGDVVSEPPPVLDLISIHNAKVAAAAAASTPTAPKKAEDAFDPNWPTGDILGGLDLSSSTGSTGMPSGASTRGGLDLSSSTGSTSMPSGASTVRSGGGAAALEARCSSCGAAFVEGAAFCAQCGTRRQVAEASISPSGMRAMPAGTFSGAASSSSGPAGYIGGPLRSPPVNRHGASGMQQGPGAWAGGARPGPAMGSLTMSGVPQPTRPQARPKAWPTAHEVQSMQADVPSDPFAWSEKFMEDFRAGQL